MTMRDLISRWERRASDREETARRFGVTTIEGRIMQAVALQLRECIAELEQAERGT